MTEVFVEVRFEAAHYLPKVPAGHKCARLHGHSYLVRLTVRGEVDESGWVIDYADVKAAWQPLHDRLDQQHPQHHRRAGELHQRAARPVDLGSPRSSRPGRGRGA